MAQFKSKTELLSEAKAASKLFLKNIPGNMKRFREEYPPDFALTNTLANAVIDRMYFISVRPYIIYTMSFKLSLSYWYLANS